VVGISRYCLSVGSRVDGVQRVSRMFQRVGKLRFSTLSAPFLSPLSAFLFSSANSQRSGSDRVEIASKQEQ